MLCGVASEEELLAAFERLKEQDIPCCLWREDDMGMKATAVATGPLRGKQRRPLKGFKLLTA